MIFRGRDLRARGRKREPGTMNREEKAYAAHLEGLTHLGRVQWWAFERMKLKLADSTFFTVDFVVLTQDGFLECHEVKARWSNGKPGIEDDAAVKIKVAADQFPFTFKVVYRARDGSWVSKDY